MRRRENIQESASWCRKGVGKMPSKVYIRDFATRSVIEEIEVHYPPDSRQYEQFEMGLNRNMDLDRFYLDDDEYLKASKGGR